MKCILPVNKTYSCPCLDELGLCKQTCGQNEPYPTKTLMVTNCVSNSSHWQTINFISRVLRSLFRFNLQNLIMQTTSQIADLVDKATAVVLPRLLQITDSSL